jgi:hypothetical protein
MTDNAIQTAHDPSAPKDEQQDAMREAQKNAIPSSVEDMMPLIKFMTQQYEDQQFAKALTKPNVIPYPSMAAAKGESGMQSVYLDERRVEMLGEYYERPGAFGFDMMRAMVDQTPILSAVIMTRERQIRRFCRVQETGKGPGFAIRHKDQSIKMGKTEQSTITLLESFFTNCGWESKPRQRMRLRRDNFSGFMSKLVRDTLTMDSAAIETEWKRDKAKGLDGMYAVDGATIRLCTESGYRGDDELFALQVVQGNIRAAYTYDDLIYVPRNPRTDVMVGGYGMSEVELLIKVVTGFLNAMTYNLKFFDSNTIPKGILHMAGDYSAEDLNSFKRYWNAMTKGVANAWTMPVMIAKNGESKASFEKFDVDVDELMFGKWMTFLTSIICAIYGMAPDEINFESFTTGTSSLSGSDTEEKLINSKDKGLRPLLSYFEDLFSDYVVSEFNENYVFRWTGLDEMDSKQAWTEENAISTWGEARKARGQDEIADDVLNNAPLNPNLMGIYMQTVMGGGDDDSQPAGAAPAKPKKAPKSDSELQKAFGLPQFRVDP